MTPVDDTSVPPGQNGTILMAADWIALAPGTAAPTTTGTQTAEPLPTSGTGDLVTYHNNATLKTIQGMVAGLPGQMWTHYSKGAGQVDFAHLHASGTALGKLKLFATTGLTSMAPGTGVMAFQYDATVTQWRLVFHEQGAWITPTFAAGNFTGSGSMAWDIAAGDVTVCRYKLRGKTLEVAFKLDTCTVGGTPSTILQIGSGAYGGFTWASAVVDATGYVLDAGAVVDAYFQAGASLGVYKRNSSNWTAGTNNNYVYGSFAGEVT